MIDVPDEDDAAPEFASVRDDLLRGMLATVQPAQVYLVKVDQWFGGKWLGFSCKRLGAYGLWADRLTLPPFHPNRIACQRHYSRAGTEPRYDFDGEGCRLHVGQPSESNLARTVDRTPFRSASLVWYSGATRRLDRASLMVYYNTPDTEPGYVWTSGWHASFRRKPEGAWGVDRTDGIARNELETFQHLGRACESA